jgi:hypothetical protein
VGREVDLWAGNTYLLTYLIQILSQNQHVLFLPNYN